MRFGFCGPDYRARSPYALDMRAINVIMEQDETGGQAKSSWIMYGRPGLKKFATIAGAKSVRAQFEFNGRHFAIIDGGFYEFFKDATFINRGAVLNDGKPAAIDGGLTFLLIAAAGNAYSFNLANNTLAPIDTTTGAALQGQVSQVAFSDGFYLALLSATNKWQTSNPADATTWNPLNIAEVSVYGENVVGFLVDHREVALFGNKRSVAYFDSGNLFPFDVVPGGFLEQGLDAAASLSRFDNAIGWIGRDERGSRIAWRLQGYNNVRISHHGVEQIWQQYSTMADAVGFSYQLGGHTFWHLYLPTVDKSWIYDARCGCWLEWNSLKVDGKTTGAFPAQSHAFAFDKHLVGDPTSGTIYEMSFAYLTDDGRPIIGTRRAPVIAEENEYIQLERLILDLEKGLAPGALLYEEDGKTLRPARIIVRCSKDGGKTFGSERILDVGRVGDYGGRVVSHRFGRGRAFVFEVSWSDPIPWRFIDAFYNEPSDRMSNRLRQVA